MGRLDHSQDLLQGLTDVCRERGFTAGWLHAIGAVQRARVAFYDQQARTYEFREWNEPLEIVSLTGNVSLRDGGPVIHAHVALADRQGRIVGGHLAPGTIVFACEFTIQAFESERFVRGHDAVTGLPLWAP
jgi:predicted DNA-binding protein with PD1-like motif